MEKQLISYLIILFVITTSFSQDINQIKLANEYYLSKDFDKAADIYKKLSKQKENLEQIHTNYLDLMVNNGVYDKAFNYIKRVVKIYPNVSRYWVDYIYVASLLTNQKEYNRLKQVLVDRYIRNANALKKYQRNLFFEKCMMMH